MSADTAEPIVVVGAGQAGSQAVATLRAEGYSGALTLIGDEHFLPYQRPPLSKAYLRGEFDRERLFFKPAQFYRDLECEVVLNTPVVAIDRGARLVRLQDRTTRSYGKLLLATGSRVRPLAAPGSSLEGIHYLRNIADVDALREAFSPGRRLAIVGGGYIGLEVAAVAVMRGLQVTVFEALDRLMARAVSPPISAHYETLHRANGNAVLIDTCVEHFEGDGRLRGLHAGGRYYEADLALIGIGILPNEELARAAGLDVSDGIVVDDTARTSDENIFAAGDCTRHPGRAGGMIRLECVQNAIDQAKHAAYAMLGKPRRCAKVPWFWSDQFDTKLQIAGLRKADDEMILRGDPASGKFAVFHLREGQVAAVEAVNAAPDYLVGRKWIEAGSPVAAEVLSDATIPLQEHSPGLIGK